MVLNRSMEGPVLILMIPQVYLILLTLQLSLTALWVVGVCIWACQDIIVLLGTM